MTTLTKTTGTKNNENFAAMLEESLAVKEMRQGEIITAEVVSIDSDVVIVNAGLKSESFIKADEFYNDKREVEVEVGDFVKVAIEKLEDGYGSTILSRDRAKKIQAWEDLENAMNDKTTVSGFVSSRVKGGLRVSVKGITAFLPGSLVDSRPVKDTSPYENKETELKVIKIDKKRNNIVVSRKAVLEEQMGADRESIIESLSEGATVKGIIKNITDYGAFVDLGGIDGLLHITDLAWKRIKHPSEVINVGDEIEAKVLKYDQDKNRVSLGLKQLGDDPWVGLERRYPVSTRIFGKVSNLTDYGAFVEIESGIEGLVHVSEMDWTNKNIHPTKVVNLGDEIEVMILEVDESKRRLSLGIKQCKENPWQAFENDHKQGETINGLIKSITDFGIFIGLNGGIDGLIHLSDISVSESNEDAVKKYKKGDEVEAKILAIDVDKERISLGIKQLTAEYIEDDKDDKDDKVDNSSSKKDAKKAKSTADKEPENAGTTNLGALLKAKMSNESDKNN